MIRVLFPSTGIDPGGVYTSEAITARSLADDGGFEVVVAVACPGKVSEVYERSGLPVYYYGLERHLPSLRYTESIGAKIKAIPSYIAGCWLAYRFLNQFKPDILHISDTQAVIIWGIAAKLKKKPLVWHIRSEKNFGISDKLRLLLADHLVFVAEHNKVRFRKYKSLPPSDVIYNTVSSDIFIPSDNRISLRSEFCIDTNAVLVGFIGNYVSRKRPDWVARIISDLIKEGINVACIFAGETSFRDSAFAMVKEIVDSSGAPERFYLLEYQKEVQKLMSILDILVLPTTAEGMPRVILEAMACKVAVVSTYVAGIPEVVQDKVNGLLFDVDDYIGMKAGVRELVLNDALRNKISNEGFLAVQGKYLPANNISLYKQLYKKISG